MINVKINNSSSQWDCLSSDVCINGAVTPVLGMEVLVTGNVVMICVVVDKVDTDVVPVTCTQSLSCVAVPSLSIIIPN